MFTFFFFSEKHVRTTSTNVKDQYCYIIIMLYYNNDVASSVMSIPFVLMELFISLLLKKMVCYLTFCWIFVVRFDSFLLQIKNMLSLIFQFRKLHLWETYDNFWCFNISSNHENWFWSMGNITSAIYFDTWFLHVNISFSKNYDKVIRTSYWKKKSK